jgi:hypothetical protein
VSFMQVRAVRCGPNRPRSARSSSTARCLPGPRGPRNFALVKHRFAVRDVMPRRICVSNGSCVQCRVRMTPRTVRAGRANAAVLYRGGTVRIKSSLPAAQFVFRDNRRRGRRAPPLNSERRLRLFVPIGTVYLGWGAMHRQLSARKLLWRRAGRMIARNCVGLIVGRGAS